MKTGRFIPTCVVQIVLLSLGLSSEALASTPQLGLSGGSSSFVITANGGLYAWGHNYQGNLGNGERVTNSPFAVTTPVMVRPPQGVNGWKIVTGGSPTLAIGDDDNLYRWGNTNYASSSGGFQTTPLIVPRPSGVSRWVAVAGGRLAIGDDGNLYQWDFRHQVTPGIVAKSEGVAFWASAATGRSYQLALANNGELYEWTLDITDVRQVLKPPGVTRWVAAASGLVHHLALGDDGQVYGWGFNSQGQLGTGAAANQATPAPILMPQGVAFWKQVAAGGFFSLALGSDDYLYAWGSITGTPIPARVKFPAGVSRWVTFTGGAAHALAIGDDCRLFAWGMNAFGQLGTGDTTPRTEPTLVQHLENLCLPPRPAGDPDAVTLVPLHAAFQSLDRFKFFVFGPTNQPFVVKHSSDLKNWTPFATNVPAFGYCEVTDSSLFGSSYRFYRVASP